MSAIIGTLLWQAGSYALRKLSEKKGGTTGAVLATVANIVESAQDQKPEDAQATIGRALQHMPSESRAELYELEVELGNIAKEREKNKQAHEVAMYTQEQQTHRIEAEQGTDYVKNTRPWVCRTSLKATIWYVITMECLCVITKAFEIEGFNGANWQVMGAFLSPCLGYMGMRTVDAFSKWKTAPQSILNNITKR